MCFRGDRRQRSGVFYRWLTDGWVDNVDRAPIGVDAIGELGTALLHLQHAVFVGGTLRVGAHRPPARNAWGRSKKRSPPGGPGN